MSRLVHRFPLLLLIVLAACSTRPVPTASELHTDLAEGTAKRLISTWQEQVRQFVDRQGGGDPAVLSQTRALHSRDVLRPGRITFGVLDTGSDLPGRRGWDIQGVLIGRQAGGAHSWYIFVVGIVRRSNYRPIEIQDIRLVALSAQGRKLSWETSAANPRAVQRYRDTFAGSDPVRFPGETDSFKMTASGELVRVQELQSGADWSLRLSAATPGSEVRITVPLPPRPG